MKSDHSITILIFLLVAVSYLSISQESFVQYDVSKDGYPPNGNWFPGNCKKFTGFIR